MNARSFIPGSIKDIVRCGVRSIKKDAGYVHHQYLGCDLEMCVRDGLALRWYGKDWFEHDRQEFQELVRHDLPRDGMAFNLGAHHGLISMLLKQKIFPSGKVVSVEIDPINFDTCRRNIARNRIHGIECINAAVADRISSVQFKGSSNNSIETSPSLMKKIVRMQIITTTVDSLCAKFGFPSLIYMDIEGAEILAMQGANRALQEVKTWFVELHGDEVCARYGGRNIQVGNTLVENGYSLFLSLRESEGFVPICAVEEMPSQRCYVMASK